MAEAASYRRAGFEASRLPPGAEVPSFDYVELAPKRTRYCLVVPVLNEGERFSRQLERMATSGVCDACDVIIADGGSTDGSVEPALLASRGVRALLIKTGPGRLSAQLRMAIAYALAEGYEGIVTVDGNGKDGVEAVPLFVEALDRGFDFVQGSRYLPGGREENTPAIRKWAVKLVHAPAITIASRFRYTDTTNGFRAFSRPCLVDPRVAPLRDVFDTYNLHYYLSVRLPRLGYSVMEVPVTRLYPIAGPLPSKIKGVRANVSLLEQLFRACVGAYDPPAK